VNPYKEADEIHRELNSLFDKSNELADRFHRYALKKTIRTYDIPQDTELQRTLKEISSSLSDTFNKFLFYESKEPKKNERREIKDHQELVEYERKQAESIIELIGYENLLLYIKDIQRNGLQKANVKWEKRL
jgi:hypothetical protein